MSKEQSARSIASLAVLLQSGALDPVALAEETFAAIRAHDDAAIFTRLTEERALREAQAAAARLKAGRARGLLDGIPIAWKDLFDMEGTVTTAGSVVLAGDAPAAKDADVVAALSAAGMVSVGRLNMSEFAFSGLGINPHYGTPKNPRSSDGHRLPAARPPAAAWPWRQAWCLSRSAPTPAARSAFPPPSMASSATRRAVVATVWQASSRWRPASIPSVRSAVPCRTPSGWTPPCAG